MENSAKILLLGKTGTGKSSFINYFLGRDVAKTGIGMPVTQDYFKAYEIDGERYPVEIFDTKGLEALEANQQLDEILAGIKKRNNSDDIFDWFHTIFYCISMSNPRFEDFEVKFIDRLRDELTQHIHIIITHCDCEPEKIKQMHDYIRDKLADTNDIEIFEVVSVYKKKRNGDVVEPCGKELISERVFDILSKDIAYKLSIEYAQTIQSSYYRIIDRLFDDLDDFIDETLKLKTLGELIKDFDETMDKIDRKMDDFTDELDEKIQALIKQTDEKFNKILRPVAELYSSYWDTVNDFHAHNVGLALDDAIEWMDSDWMGELDDYLLSKVLPNIGKYMDVEPDSLFEIFGMIGAGIIDLFNLKKNVKRVMVDFKYKLKYKSFPSKDEIQAKAYEKIVNYIKTAPNN